MYASCDESAGGCIFPLFVPQTIAGRVSMRDKQSENEAMQKAWELFEKTGQISYYMLYHDLMRKR